MSRLLQPLAVSEERLRGVLVACFLLLGAYLFAFLVAYMSVISLIGLLVLIAGNLTLWTIWVHREQLMRCDLLMPVLPLLCWFAVTVLTKTISMFLAGPPADTGLLRFLAWDKGLSNAVVEPALVLLLSFPYWLRWKLPSGRPRMWYALIYLIGSCVVSGVLIPVLVPALPE